jgi:hypothetical protein
MGACGAGAVARRQWRASQNLGSRAHCSAFRHPAISDGSGATEAADAAKSRTLGSQRCSGNDHGRRAAAAWAHERMALLA